MKTQSICGNISDGGDERACGFAVPIKFLTAERKAISNAARKYTAAVRCKCKLAQTCIVQKQ